MRSRNEVRAAGQRRRYFRLTYSNAPDDDPKLFQARDGIAFNELSAGLPDLGYEFGTTIHLYPDDERTMADYPALLPGDLLVMSTRPPLDDRLYPPRKKIRPTKGNFEGAIFAALRKYFAFCNRKHMELARHAIGQLSGSTDRWNHVELFEHCGAEVMRHFPTPHHKGLPARPGPPYTVAFFLRENNVPGIGCDLLLSFGMDGYGTLIWNHIVRRQHPDWLANPCFVMAELVFKKPIPPKPLTPEFANDPNHIEVHLLT